MDSRLLFSARGLYWIGRDDVVRSHLDRLIRETEPSLGLVPKVMDSISPRYRVLWNSVLRKLPSLQKRIPDIRDPIHSEYQDEHGSRAIDSNLLALIAAEEWRRRGSLSAAERAEWFHRNIPTFTKWFRYYESLRDPGDGLIQQPAYSDWQDSTQRTGKTFYTNLLLLKVLIAYRSVSELGISDADILKVTEKLRSTFYDSASGLYRSLEVGPPISLDGNLLLLDWRILEGADSTRARELYKNLKRSQLFQGAEFAGFATAPPYPWSQKSVAVRIAGLEGYHDQLHWSWLMGLLGDVEEYDRMTLALEGFAVRDGTIREIYDSRKGYCPFQKALFSAEKEFSWGAAMILDALNEPIL